MERRVRADPGDRSGQYMVEFGMTIGIFIFVVMASVNLILAGYNYTTTQRAAWEAARRAATDATNAEIAQIIHDELVSKYYGSMMIMSAVQFDKNTYITPNAIRDRAEGKMISVNLGFKIGLSLGILGSVTANAPISTRLAVIAKNDEDRDGIRDADEAFVNQEDHDNDAVKDTGDTDDDNDGILDVDDTGVIVRQPYGWWDWSWLYKSNGSPAQWLYPFDGKFAARQIHVRSDRTVVYEPWPIFPRAIPRDYYPRDARWSIYLPIRIDLSYDADNDAWEDKWDAQPNNVYGGFQNVIH